MLKRYFMGGTEPIGEREVGVVCSTPQQGRDGLIVEPAGAKLDNYRANPIWLWSHDPTCPVGVATMIGVVNGDLAARVQFAPPGVSAKADEICGLVKSGVVTGVSIGFDIIDSAPLDRNNPRGGEHVTTWELLECSFVSVPADTGAGVVQRGARLTRWQWANRCPAVPRDSLERAKARLVAPTPEERLAALVANARAGNMPPYCPDPAEYAYLYRIYLEAGHPRLR